jgi:hypothetical protein
LPAAGSNAFWLAITSVRFDKIDRILAALNVIRSLPQLARHFEDVIWHDHGKRGTLLSVSKPHSFAADFERRIENMDDKLKPFALDLAAENDSPLPLNQTELKYDVGA